MPIHSCAKCKRDLMWEEIETGMCLMCDSAIVSAVFGNEMSPHKCRVSLWDITPLVGWTIIIIFWFLWLVWE